MICQITLPAESDQLTGPPVPSRAADFDRGGGGAVRGLFEQVVMIAAGAGAGPGKETMSISKRIAALVATAVAALGLTVGAVALQGGDTSAQAGVIVSRP